MTERGIENDNEFIAQARELRLQASQRDGPTASWFRISAPGDLSPSPALESPSGRSAELRPAGPHAEPSNSAVTFSFILEAPNGPTNASASTTDDLCLVCVDRPRELALLYCGHSGFCGNCYLRLQTCPVYRAVIRGEVRTRRSEN